MSAIDAVNSSMAVAKNAMQWNRLNGTAAHHHCVAKLKVRKPSAKSTESRTTERSEMPLNSQGTKKAQRKQKVESTLSWFSKELCL